MLRLKEILREKDMKAKTLAELLGMTPQQISGIVREVDNASVQMLAKIADALEVPLASLFDGYDGGARFVCPKCGAKLKLVEDKEDGREEDK